MPACESTAKLAHQCLVTAHFPYPCMRVSPRRQRKEEMPSGSLRVLNQCEMLSFRQRKATIVPSYYATLRLPGTFSNDVIQGFVQLVETLVGLV